MFKIIGQYSIGFFNLMGGLFFMLRDSFIWGIRPPFRRKVIMEQMVSIGINSLPVVILTGTFTGMVFAYQAYTGFKMFGAEVYTGTIVSLAMAWELGPVLSSIMVTARAGSAMTAEIGTMKVTEQIDALSVLAVDPIQYLAWPRILAAILMMPLLSFTAVIFGIIGGYFVGVSGLKINSTLYIHYTFLHLELIDILKGTFKALIFGMLLSLVGCYKGFKVSGGALGVGKATTESVVISCVLILLFDYILTALMFG